MNTSAVRRSDNVLLQPRISTPIVYPDMEEFYDHYLQYKEHIDQRMANVVHRSEPRSLYEPITHVLEGGGKRIRGVLVMLAADAVGGSGIDALHAGASLEILHNFTLVHDDIMDRAATRRGRATVHTRWDEGVGILTGDAMIGLALRILLDEPPKRIAEVIKALSQGLIDVCEGQTLDRDFETRRDVTIDEYLAMIAMKTGRLAEVAAEVGGIMGNGTEREIEALKAYARHIGLAFQIQDDLLDIVAEEAELGKKIGGDIIEGKKTYLVIKANECVTSGEDRQMLDTFLDNHGLPESEVAGMRDLFERYGVLQEAQMEIERHTLAAERELYPLADGPARTMLVQFSHMLLNRNR